MNIVNSFSAIEMQRNNPIHLGASQTLNSSVFFAKDGAEKTAESSRGSFESYLIGALDFVNQAQLKQSAIEQQVLVDPESVDIHEVTTAMAMASLSLEAANRIITQMVSSWNEITTTR